MTVEDKIKRSFQETRKRPLFLLVLLVVIMFIYATFARDLIKIRESKRSVESLINTVSAQAKIYEEKIIEHDFANVSMLPLYIEFKNTVEPDIEVIISQDNKVLFSSLGSNLNKNQQQVIDYIDYGNKKQGYRYIRALKNDKNENYLMLYHTEGKLKTIYLIDSAQINRFLSKQALPHIVMTDDHNYVLGQTGLDVKDKLGKFYLTHGIKDDFQVHQTSILDKQINIYYLFSRSYRRLDYMYFAVMLIFSFVLINHSIRKMAKKVGEDIGDTMQQLLLATNQIKRGKYGQKITFETDDEFQDLIDAFNEMSSELKDTLNQNAFLLEESKKAQIKQLEAQFNPHFLFNSLENLRYLMALDSDLASDIILDLAEILRYSLDKEFGSITTVQHDLSYIKKYLNLHQLRLGEAFEYSVSCDQSVLSYQVPKLLVQPLIENSLNHVYPKKGKLKLSISIRDYITHIAFVVEDDGGLLSEKDREKLDQLIKFKNFDKQNGFGIKSIVSRMHLLYGLEGKVKYKNDEYGTRFIVMVPKGEKDNAQAHNHRR